MSINGELAEPFSGRTLDMKFPEHDYSSEILDASRTNYCRAKDEVEELINAWDEAGQSGIENNRQEPVRKANGLKNGAAFDASDPVFEMPMI